VRKYAKATLIILLGSLTTPGCKKTPRRSATADLLDPDAAAAPDSTSTTDASGALNDGGVDGSGDSASSPTALGAFIAKMTAGQWQELKGTGLEKVVSIPLSESDNDSCRNIITWCHKAHWHPATRQILYLGSPHLNDYRFIIYSADQNSWRVGPKTGYACMYGEDPNAPHCGFHSFGRTTIDAASGRFYMTHGGSAPTQPLFTYDIGKDSWSMKKVPGAGDSATGATLFFPELNRFVFAGRWGRTIYDPVANKTTPIELNGKTVYGTAQPLHLTGVYLPLLGKVLFGGGNGYKNLFAIDKTGVVTKLTDAPDKIGQSAENGLLTYDPVTNNALLYSGGGRFYEYDVKQDAWSQLPEPSFAALLDKYLGHMAAAPIDTYGAVVLLMSSGQVLVYKHKQGP
jgi:hypothetical protein